MNAFKPRSPPTGGGAEGWGESMNVFPAPVRNALADLMQELGLEWEIYIDEDERCEHLFARGSVDGVNIMISCKPSECKVEAPDYNVAPCYIKPTLVGKCIYEVVSRVKEAEKITDNLLQVAEKLVEYGFKVSKSNRSIGIIAYKSIDGGEIEIVLNSPEYDSVLKMEIRARSPVKLVLVAMKLAELL
jgi:hypothetical protein